ncbi:hypothetical protein F4779DRAFT_572603 [Xylariaceae sp. FL0662B]|nr:hypothetical protein F4779DRAFT_572603 [Xylariaceae sp. FL0662B]
MMLTRGLSPIGIGTDICKIARIHKNLTSGQGVRFVQRILTPEELQQERTAKILKCVYPSQSRNKSRAAELSRDREFHRAATFMAGRFAAKEAVVKAYPLRKLFFHDILVMRQADLLDSSSLSLLSSSTRESLMHMLNPSAVGQTEREPTEEEIELSSQPSGGPPVAIVKGDAVYKDTYAPISISHDGDYAIAVCLASLMEKKA